MTFLTYTEEEKELLDSRFATLVMNMQYIASHLPREHVLYPMMEKPIYDDFETLIAGTIEDNDNEPTIN